MKQVDSISYSFSLGTMRVYVHIGGKSFSIGGVEITDRDFDEDEEIEYMQNLAEEFAYDLGYEVA